MADPHHPTHTHIFFCLQKALNMIYWEIAIKIHLSQKSEGTLEHDASAHAHFSLRTAETPFTSH